MFYGYLLTLKLITWSEMALSAPPITNLNVSGSIIPPTCTLNNQIEETYTYRFDISPGIFPENGNLILYPQTQNAEVVCDAVTYLTFIATDQRAGTELLTGSNFYGLGTYNTNTKIGYFAGSGPNVRIWPLIDVINNSFIWIWQKELLKAKNDNHINPVKGI